MVTRTNVVRDKLVKQRKMRGSYRLHSDDHHRNQGAKGPEAVPCAQRDETLRNGTASVPFICQPDYRDFPA